MSTQVNCPGCNQAITCEPQPVAGTVTCPACQLNFTLEPAAASPPPLKPLTPTPGFAENTEQLVERRRKAIRTQALIMTILAAVFLLFGLYAYLERLLFMGFYAEPGRFSNNAGLLLPERTFGLLTMIPSFTTSAFLYLIAQVLHIRANTEK